MFNTKLLIIALIFFKVNFFSFYNATSIQKCSESTLVQTETKSGKIKGSCSFVYVEDDKEFKSGNVYSWLAIPYAEPPINDNRFKDPVPVKPWSDELNATKLPNSCMQLTGEDYEENFEAHKIFKLNNQTMISEDCLYLNVWSPAKAFLKIDVNNAEANKVPVLVFFHGGGSTKGASSLDIYDPSVLVTFTEIIVVTVNYRLGLFGFFHLNDSHSTHEALSGNQAILDQNLALKWIWENVAAFGGDPARITIAGHGFGALLASYHLLYKPSWPFFRNIIIQSGSLLNTAHQAITSLEATQRTKLFVSMYTTCKDNKDLVKCLRSIPAENLTYSAGLFLNHYIHEHNKYASVYLRTPFPPVVDDRVLTDKPLNMLASNNFKQCSMLAGYVANEGAFYLTQTPLLTLNKVQKPMVNFRGLVEFLDKYFIFNTSEPFISRKNFLTNSILFEYTQMTRKFENDISLIKNEYLGVLDKLVGDEYWRCSILELANFFSKKNKVFVYAFDHRLSKSRWPANMFNSASHGDELAVIFGHVLGDFENTRLSNTYNPWRNQKNSSFLETEKQLAKEVLAHLSDFVHFDNPNVDNTRYKSMQSTKNWPQYFKLDFLPTGFSNKIKKEGQFFSFRIDGTKVMQIKSSDKCHFWNSLLPDLKQNLNQIVQNECHL